MNRTPSRRLSRFSLGAFAFLALTALPHTSRSDVVISIVEASPTEPGVPRLSLELISGSPGSAVPLQKNPTLDSGAWSSFDSLILDSGGSASTFVTVEPETPKFFFRAILPLPEITTLEPSTIPAAGGQFYILGQLFDPTFVVRIDGNLVSSTFINSTTIQVNAGPLTIGFHDISIFDSGNNLVASLPHVLTVTTTGRTDQESPPSAPLVMPPQDGAVVLKLKPELIVLGGADCDHDVLVYDWQLADSGSSGITNGPPGSLGNPGMDPNVGVGGPFVMGPGGIMMPMYPPATNPGPITVDPGFGLGTGGLFGGGVTMPPSAFDPPATQGGGVYIPEVWRIDPVPWNRDVAPQNKIDDLIDAGPGTRHDIIVDFRDIIVPEPLPKVEPLFGAPGVNEATGEVFVRSVDLVIPGRGLDLVWARTYRSKIGMDTPMGVGWDFSYNIRAAQNGPNITVQDGQNRTDTYFLQGDGSFSNDELFRRGTMAGPVFTLQFANKTNWIFRPFDGSPAAGKIAQIVDRNSNQLQFQYDPGSGRLMSIIDSLGRPFTLNYVPAGPLAGRLQAVQDFAGRAIVYQHHNGGGPGGSLGDLLVVRSPIVNGTPTGNDFPSGKTAQFTYSAGLGGARDHNLLTMRDGNNVQWFQANYTPTATATDFLFDRVAALIIGTAGETKVFTYLPQPPAPANAFATTKTIVNDAVGNVHESLFDSKNRLLDLRRFTGRSTPGVAVTESTNRPTGQLRMTDPAFFTTTINWNRDSLPTSIMLPRGNGVQMLYERDFDPATNPRLRGNLRVHRQIPTTGSPLVQRFDYQAGFGTSEFGGAIQAAVVIGQSSTSAASDIWASRLMEEEGIYYGFEGDPDRPLVVGSVYNAVERSGILPQGNYQLSVSGHGGVEHSRPMESLSCFHGGDNHSRPMESISFCISRTDARGFTWTCARDANGNAISMTRPDGGTTDIEHNANGQLTAIVWPQNNTGHRERDEWHYYAGGPQNGYLQSFIRDAGGLKLTTGFTHNSVGCVTQVVDPRGKDTQFFVNQLNQVVQVTSRDAGSGIRYLTNIFRDANNRVTSVDVQNKDEFGVVGANAFFTTSYLYDSLDRVTSMTREVDSGHTVTTQYFYNAIRDLIEVRSPLAVTAVQPDARVQYAYDERNLPFTATAAPGSPNATRSTYSYDANGHLNKVEKGAPAGPQHTATAIYDGFDRLSQSTSPVGTQTSYAYNAVHQRTQKSVTGTFLDSGGSPTTGLLAATTWNYAPNRVCIGQVDSFFDVTFQVPILDGARTTTYSYDPALNRTGRTDDNNHTTQYSYDGANRLGRVTDPKGNRVDYTYDNNGNLVTRSRTDKSDTAAPDQVFTTTYVYDGLDRRITSTDNVGNARSYMYDSRSNRVRLVDPRGNLTQYEYDGLNRLLRRGVDMNANSSGFDAGTDIISGRIWDDNSRLLSASNPNSYATQNQYDPLGRRIQRTNADATIKTWSYDPWSNVVQANDENGTVCVHNYDNLNRLKQRTVTAGAGVSNATTFELYDYPGDYQTRERAINDAANVRYMYDSLGRLTSEQLGSRTTFYTHDGAGNLLTLQSPGGRVITYAYDLANLCTSLSLSATGDGDSLGTIATYNHIGRRVESATHRNGTSTVYTYDGFVGAPVSPDLGWGRIASSVTTGAGPTVLDQRTFTYDAAQNLSERQDTRAGGPQLLHHYDYDPANRLVHAQVNSPGPTLVRDTIYNYDRNGNRLAVNGPNTLNPGLYTQDGTTPTPADAQMGQYTSTPLGNYLYDANGNRINVTTGAGTNYKYDYANRLVDLTNATTSVRIANYQYDPLGRRIQKTFDPDGTAQLTNFLFGGSGIIEERNGAGSVTASYTPDESIGELSVMGKGLLYGRDSQATAVPIPLPVEVRRGGTNYEYHAEVVPQLWFMTNTSSVAVERYEYDDFGTPSFFTGGGLPLTGSAIGNPFLFDGMRFDSESGLYLGASVPAGRATVVLRDRNMNNDPPCMMMFDPKIGASLQHEPSHALCILRFNLWSGDIKVGGQHVMRLME